MHRSEETAVLKRRWEDGRLASGLSKSPKASSNDGYEFLRSIHAVLAPEYELFSEALFTLQVLGLDGDDWRRRLEELARVGGGSAQDNFAFAMMQDFVVRQGVTNVKLAAERSVAFMGLYPDAASFHSAVTRCRGVWRRYKDGTFRPKGMVVEQKGIFVRPRTDNLRRYEVRAIRDPDDLTLLPATGRRVSDNAYWRRLTELGFVEIVQAD